MNEKPYKTLETQFAVVGKDPYILYLSIDYMSKALKEASFLNKILLKHNGK